MVVNGEMNAVQWGARQNENAMVRCVTAMVEDKGSGRGNKCWARVVTDEKEVADGGGSPNKKAMVRCVKIEAVDERSAGGKNSRSAEKVPKCWETVETLRWLAGVSVVLKCETEKNRRSPWWDA